jgi:uncharacterized damage-inducible protein DinB
MRDDFASLFAYTRWADDRVLTACRALTQEQYTRELPGGMASLRSTLVHLAGATRAWSRRLAGEAVTVLPKEEEVPTVEDAARMLAEANAAFDRLLAAETPETLNSLFAWRNLKNEEKKAPRWTVLRHVVNHGTYHRGQIAVKLKRLGVEPPQTDLIFWAIEETAKAK